MEKRTSRYEHLLWDIDGTLTDPAVGITTATQLALRRCGIEVEDRQSLCKFIGPPLEWSMETYYGLEPRTAKAWAEIYRRIYTEENCIAKSRLYPYIRESLALIREKGGKCAVTSLKMDRMVAATLEVYDLAPEFDALVGRSEVCPTKADTIREAMRLLDWPGTADVVLFGDSRYDGEGAREAGVAFVPLTYGFGFAEEGSMEGLDCAAVAREPEDVYRFIRAQFEGE